MLWICPGFVWQSLFALSYVHGIPWHLNDPWKLLVLAAAAGNVATTHHHQHWPWQSVPKTSLARLRIQTKIESNDICQNPLKYHWYKLKTIYSIAMKRNGLLLSESNDGLTERHRQWPWKFAAHPPPLPVTVWEMPYKQCFTNNVWRATSICIMETIMWKIVISHSNEFGNMRSRCVTLSHKRCP